MDPSLEKTAEHTEVQSDLSVMSVSVGAWEHSRETIPRWNGQRDLAGAAAEGKQLQLATSAMIIACHMFAPPDPGNGSGDCPLFCKLCRTEVNEKTTKPRTFSPGNFQSREKDRTWEIGKKSPDRLALRSAIIAKAGAAIARGHLLSTGLCRTA